MRYDTSWTPTEVLQDAWGYPTFRPCQEDIVKSVLEGHDTLGLLPTGGGKSVTFQVPALMLPGLTIVVTPLVSLMKDQVDNLAARGIRAVCLYAGLSRREKQLAIDRCRLGKTKMLYVSPERLRSPDFLQLIRSWTVSLIVVDEAHCISQWGYDFRPSYLRIADLRQVVGPHVPVLALTASATPQVVADIQQQLQFRPDSRMFSLSFMRDNISFIVRNTISKEDKLIGVLQATQGTAIVYVRSRAKTARLAQTLQAAGISASFYHAALDPEIKAQRQQDWRDGRVRVIVATNAFGMGIDKADVRTVIHMDLPPSLEEYYQEAGRAGRDGKESYAVVITGPRDKATLTRRLNDSFPPLDYVRQVYEKMCVFLDVPVGHGFQRTYEFALEKFCDVFGFQDGPVRGALALLTQAGYIEYTEQTAAQSRVMLLCRRDELYDYALPTKQDQVLTALLRSYTGLFSDYANISETQISLMTDLSGQDVYESLLALARNGILHYVPRRNTPYVSFTTSREATRYIQLPDAVYLHRRQQMERRLDSVRRFAFDNSRCRSQQMLEWFGETDSAPCGKCDVCRAGRTATPSANTQSPADIDASILHVARRGVTLTQLLATVRADAPTVTARVRALVDDGRLRLDGATLHTI